MRRLLLPLLAALICCAPARAIRRPAHASFDKSGFDSTWERALEVLHAEGYELSFSDRARGILLTAERELQAPCGDAQCLSRETVSLRVGPGTKAMLSVHRTRWDQASASFVEGFEPRSVEAVEKTEAALLAAITGGATELRLARDGESCATDSECEAGLACKSRKCSR